MPTPSKRLAILAAAVLVLAACGQDDAKKTEQRVADEAKAIAQTPPAPVLEEAAVTRVTVSEPITGTGSLFAVRTTDVGPSVDGIIDAVFVKVGDVVKKGQPLFRTRDVDARLTVQEVERQLSLARAQARNAAADLRRQTQLKGGGWVSAARMDNTRTSADVANAQVGVWEARLAQARQHLTDTVVRAPYNGVITRRDADEGRFMATRTGGFGGGGSGGGSGVVQVMQIDPIAAIVQVPERYLNAIQTGMMAAIMIDSVAGEFKTDVRVVNYRLDIATRSIEVRMALPNPDFKLRPGLFCRAVFEQAPRSVLTVDRRAIFGPEGAQYAFVADGTLARKVAVTARPLPSGQLEILSNVPEGTKFLMGQGAEALSDGSVLPGRGAPVRRAQTAG
jgi:RND family efflux transporter MFP subunit